MLNHVGAPIADSAHMRKHGNEISLMDVIMRAGHSITDYEYLEAIHDHHHGKSGKGDAYVVIQGMLFDGFVLPQEDITNG